MLLSGTNAKAKEKQERKTTRQNSDKSFEEIDTKKELAKVSGVSHDTIQRVELALVLKPLISAKAKERQSGGQGGVLLCQNSDEAIDTKKELAKVSGVSHDTIQRVELALVLKPLISAKAKENERAGGGSGESGRQKSDNPIDTKKELAKVSGVSHDTIQRVELALVLKPLISAKAKERMLAGKADPVQNSAQGKTRDELAKVSGVSHDTIQRGEKILKSDNKEITEKVKSGKMSINEGYNRIKRKEKKVEAKNSINEVSKISGKYRIILAERSISSTSTC